ncbi:MAG: hypothetical protein K0R14_237 [Burkholderiales bacterium]|jgi:hypothetical protein|nr:hypothetical protein [Burkholderiales bacterium]
MSDDKVMSKELQTVQNIINKLTAYMEQTGQTLFSLAQTFGFAYQPFNSLIKNKTIPSLSTLAMLSDHLCCSISELISDEFFLDVNVIYEINQLPDLAGKDKTRIYIPYNEFLPLINKQFFVLSGSKATPANMAFYLIDEIVSDGKFIVVYNKKHIIIDVLLSSSKFILIEKNDKEERIPTEEITPIAKFFKNVVMADSNENQIRGSIIQSRST